ncbi:Clavaminate synthase-like protein [Mytilinidion resinicola]|uniref:Clavaminate synthase-like protein n=1 Tax=Mytilinidion resinicola TaxID=574789 RepID=A0A6A6Z9N6_9PEZI|nr:Clavaminate synthase-like protein [Mytilinidion resinicola]KAF2817842.1 Clavaminate synthase-like protein [Mytilinidion resinicola]
MTFNVPNMAKLPGAVRDLIVSYHELNSTTIDELHEEPSPLEFMRYVARNRPFVVRKGAESWTARKVWNAKYLVDVMGRQLVNVAVTPHGNADSVIELEDDGLLFVKPYDTEEPFNKVLEKIQEKERQGIDGPGPTRYAQTQNDNLRNEYMPLFSDLPKDIPFARIALEKSPDAINLWLGNSCSITALHKDNYENIYVQVLGEKHFTLLPPIECACVNEQLIPAATYQPREPATPESPRSPSAASDNSMSSSQVRPAMTHDEVLDDLVVCLDEPEENVPFATWDPDVPSQRATPFSQYSRAMRVTLNEGDMLYLPALWYHKVAQSASSEGICCAVNYWYDVEFSGSFWPLCSLARGVGLLTLGRDPRDGEEDDG